MSHLTDFNKEAIWSLPLPDKGNRIHFVDKGVRVDRMDVPAGLGVRVTAAGAKAFVLQGRTPAGKQVRLTLAPVALLSCADAIREARKLLDTHGHVVGVPQRGVMPTAASGVAEGQEGASRGPTVDAVLDDFVQKHVKVKVRNAKETERLIDKDIRPALGTKGIHDVRRSDIDRMLDAIEARAAKRGRGGRTTATRTLAALSKAFNWYAAKNDDFVSPIIRGMARITLNETIRDRILCEDGDGHGDDGELETLWLALSAPVDADDAYERMPACYPAYVRVLVYTAQRRSEVAGMRWEEISRNKDRHWRWTIPAERMKGKKPHVVPLSSQVLAIIEGEAARNGGRRKGFVFSTDGGKTAFAGFSKSKAALDWRIDKLRRNAKQSEIAPWTLHDIRRTGRTLMGRVGVTSETAEQVIAHTVKGVRGRYDHDKNFTAKREALEKLAAEIDRITGW